ncbi:alpha/beta hydrolase [Streptomyces muensis]|uniref:Alpha/beta hydrolase n=1 Tax=Streptomyces muensis TaxID=1077944 RepID=A0A9X1PSG8_STRM4|nr:alpha/beta hydrolase [Streptomyces muensis]MCF1592283.1 alpha/beta hydrolase [Streptomyces muensis]
MSEEARAALSVDQFTDTVAEPALDDTEGWLRFIEVRDAPVREMFAQYQPSERLLTRREIEVDGVRTYELVPGHLVEKDEAPIVVEIHGGGLLMCGGDLAWQMSAHKAVKRDAITWVPDFRMPPRHPYPAALDDCLTVYRRALKERSPDQIVVSGASGGGNLAAALLLRAKDQGLPMPAALVLLTPELDLTESGDSFRTNLGIDYMGLLTRWNQLYANGEDLSHPYLSPLFGDVTGFPPTFLQTGTRDLFLSNTVRMHRKMLNAGVPVELRVLEAAPHGGFGGHTPEDAELEADVLHFEKRHLRVSE